MASDMKKDLDRYHDLLERLSWNDEIDFIYKGKEYWMVPYHAGSGWLFYQSGPIDEQHYDTRQEMLEKVRLGGKTIKEIWPETE